MLTLAASVRTEDLTATFTKMRHEDDMLTECMLNCIEVNSLYFASDHRGMCR